MSNSSSNSNGQKQLTWHQHLADFRLKNPHLKGSQVMVAASLTYKKAQDVNEKKYLTEFIKNFIIGESIVEKYNIANTKLQLEAQKLSDEIDNTKVEDLDSIKTILCNQLDYGFFSDHKGIGYIMSIVEDDSYSLIKQMIEAYHKDSGLKYKNLSYPAS